MVWKAVKIMLVAAVIVVAGAAFFWDRAQLRGQSVQAVSHLWSGSGHADSAAEAFVHWDEDEPPEVPASCAKCHSLAGFLDFMGEDGSAPGSVDGPALVGSVISCQACHNDSTHEMASAVFPSGVSVTDLGAEAVCFQCHQGRTSADQVDEATDTLGDDEVSADLGFVNVHYAIAAATQMGDVTRGGYQYPGREYVARFEHEEDVRSCTQCHDPHSGQVEPQSCAACHPNVVDQEDFQDIRYTRVDFDGDGNDAEGMYHEIVTMQELLLVAIQDYATQFLGAPVAYGDAYPYWFVDGNGDGILGDDEKNFGNRYLSFTPRLLRGAYNYHLSLEDAGNYTHNGRYVVQLLHDSIADLSAQVGGSGPSLIRP